MESWKSYYKDKLPRGWSYPSGRDEIQEALELKDVQLDSLSLSRGDQRKGVDLYVLTLRCQADVASNFMHRREKGGRLLAMTVNSVPTALSKAIRAQLRDEWLESALTWASETTARGNAWMASEHAWTLIYSRSGQHKVDKY